MYSETTLISLSPEEIRAFIVQRLKAALPGMPLEPHRQAPHRITLFHPNAGELVLNLGSLVKEVRGSTPRAAERLVDTFVSRARQAVTPPDVDLDKVYPGLRHHSFFAETGISVCDPLVGDGPGDLVSVVLADQGEGIVTLTEKMAYAAGHRTEDVLLSAEQNMVDLLPRTFGDVSADGQVLSLGIQDHPWLGTSLMFVPTAISNAMAQMGWAQVLLAAPTRETVDIVDATQRNAAKVMERWMVERLAGPRPQSELVFSFARDGVEYRNSHRMDGCHLIRLN